MLHRATFSIVKQAYIRKSVAVVTWVLNLASLSYFEGCVTNKPFNAFQCVAAVHRMPRFTFKRPTTPPHRVGFSLQQFTFRSNASLNVWRHCVCLFTFKELQTGTSSCTHVTHFVFSVELRCACCSITTTSTQEQQRCNDRYLVSLEFHELQSLTNDCGSALLGCFDHCLHHGLRTGSELRHFEHTWWSKNTTQTHVMLGWIDMNCVATGYPFQTIVLAFLMTSANVLFDSLPTSKPFKHSRNQFSK